LVPITAIVDISFPCFVCACLWCS